MLDICWSHWSALGVYANVPPETRGAIDLEALLCATMFYGRYDPRLFDEALDWIAINSRIISFDRLKKLADIFGRRCKACLGASIDTVALKNKNPRFASSVDRWNEFRLPEEENLFLSWGSERELSVKEADPTFLAWGFIRNRPNLRGLSGKPDMSNGANLFMRLRKLFGVTSRASVFGYLLLKGDGNSMQISKAIHANQRNVYGILNEMAEGGFLQQWSSGRESIFYMDRESWLGFLGMGEGVIFIRWADVFNAFQSLLEDWAANRKAYSTAYLASSRLREYMPDLAARLSSAGTDYRIPDLGRYHGESYFSALAEHIQAYLEHIGQL